MGNKYARSGRYKYISENGLKMICCLYCTALSMSMFESHWIKYESSLFVAAAYPIFEAF